MQLSDRDLHTVMGHSCEVPGAFVVMERPAQPVQFPDGQHVTSLAQCKALCSLWPLPTGSTGLVGTYLSARCQLECCQLPVRVLVIRRYTHMAYFSQPSCGLIYETIKPWIFRG
jgi:hypothetical protein